MWFERAQALEIVRGCEYVDEGECCLQASRYGGVGCASEQRVYPDQPACTAVQERECCGKPFWFTCVPAVAQDDDDGAFIVAAQPLVVEHRQACAIARSAGPAANVG